MKKNSIVIALVLALILAASAALPAFAEGEYKYHITIPGKGGSLCNSPTYVAYEKGFFAEEGIDAKVDVSELMGSSIHLHVTALDGKDVVLVVSTMNMTGAEVAALANGAPVEFSFPGHVCHVFNKETGINLEA